MAKIAVVHPEELALTLVVDLLESKGFEVEGFRDVCLLAGFEEFDLVVTNWGGSERAGYYTAGGPMLSRVIDAMRERSLEKPIVVCTGGAPSDEEKADFPQVSYWWLAAREFVDTEDVVKAINDAIAAAATE
jgi:DNA-binding response OmpR family regulator